MQEVDEQHGSSIRIGAYRVIHSIQYDIQLVRVERAVRRSEVYS